MSALILPIQEQSLASKTIECSSTKEKVNLLIFRDLQRLGWSLDYPDYSNNEIRVSPPKNYDKSTIKQSMGVKRQEIITNHKKWINDHIQLAHNNLANGFDVLDSKIIPMIEVCQTQKQHDLFRIFRLYWSSPYSEYVGRRIKLIIRDYGLPNKPVIGIAALGSPIIHIPERDNWIGWDKNTRTKNLNYTMDAYVIGALPPYNYLLGGKLISYLLTSKEVRNIFEEKYKNTKYNKLAGIFTTSLYGRSSQYNRLRLRDRLLYNPIGETKGYGTLHLTNETFNAMNDYLKENNILVSNKFGAGPSWRMRVIHSAGKLLGFDPNFLLHHSFKRKIYYIPLATNSVEFLNGKTKSLKNYNSSIKTLKSYWYRRWFQQRLCNHQVLEDVKNFRSEDFMVE
jgi:hypothetical protein